MVDVDELLDLTLTLTAFVNLFIQVERVNTFVKFLQVGVFVHSLLRYTTIKRHQKVGDPVTSLIHPCCMRTYTLLPAPVFLVNVNGKNHSPVPAVVVQSQSRCWKRPKQGVQASLLRTTTSASAWRKATTAA